MVRRTDALVISKVLEAGGAPDKLARGSRRALAKNNGANDMVTDNEEEKTAVGPQPNYTPHPYKEGYIK